MSILRQVLGRSRPTVARSVLGKFFSDSHDDFKPKKKTIDLSDDASVQALIQTHVKDHPVLLYVRSVL